MKKTLLIIGTMLFISGCNDGGGVSGYIPGGPDSGYKPRPQNPTAEYENAIVEQNKTITWSSEVAALVLVLKKCPKKHDNK